MSSISSSNFSVFIPYVFANITPERITHVFETNNLGYVQRVDLVKMIDHKGKMYYRAYVHFDTWFDNTIADNFKGRVLSGGTRLVYDDPWFWVVLQNTGTKYVSELEREEEEEDKLELELEKEDKVEDNDSYDENDQDRSFVRYSKKGEVNTYDIISDDYVSLLEFQFEEAKIQINQLKNELGAKDYELENKNTVLQICLAANDQLKRELDDSCKTIDEYKMNRASLLEHIEELETALYQ